MQEPLKICCKVLLQELAVVAEPLVLVVLAGTCAGTGWPAAGTCAGRGATCVGAAGPCACC